MANYIAVSTSSQVGLDFTLLATDLCTLLLIDGSTQPYLERGASALIQVKTSSGNYMTIGQLTKDDPIKTISGAGTYRVVTAAFTSNGTGIGVDKN